MSEYQLPSTREQLHLLVHERIASDPIEPVEVSFLSRSENPNEIIRTKAGIESTFFDSGHAGQRNIDERGVAETRQSIHQHALGNKIAELALESAVRAKGAEEREARLDDANKGLRADNDFLYEKAYLDPVTNIPNRAAFEKDLTEALISKRSTGFDYILIDLKDFKMVNDMYGLPGGDQALFAIAQSLIRKLRKGETLYRIGGDEFVILRDKKVSQENDRRQKQREYDNARREESDDQMMIELTVESSMIEATRLFLAMMGKMITSEDEVALRASCGITAYRPGDTRESIEERAEAAMKKHKRNQGPSYRQSIASTAQDSHKPSSRRTVFKRPQS